MNRKKTNLPDFKPITKDPSVKEASVVTAERVITATVIVSSIATITYSNYNMSKHLKSIVILLNI